MDFAPYQDQSPETGRTLSPPPRRSDSQSPTPGPPPPRSSKSPNNRPSTDPFGAAALPAPSYFGNGGAGGNHHDSSSGNGLGGNAAGFEGSRAHINQFETSLPMRLDYEAMLAYLLLPPAGGVFLLLVEHKSDYVRRKLRKG
ncbi:MAG: hypothetical protein M1827_002780 [Pycnora praestabilis]|nr:MAG: hypothetical protein M1827_002780 [Pycnora praestabilis]